MSNSTLRHLGLRRLGLAAMTGAALALAGCVGLIVAVAFAVYVAVLKLVQFPGAAGLARLPS